MNRRAIVVPDATRPLDVARAFGAVDRSDADVIVGLGLHRRMTDGELEPLRAACEGAAIVQHDPDDALDFTQYEEITCVGVVEPHQYAGFSGGVKGIIIGCGARSVIDEMHSLRMLRACGARVGWVDGNPFQDRLWELAAGLPPIQGLFEIPGHGELVSGPVRAAFEEAVSIARELHFEVLDEPVWSMLLQVPPSKSANFYQASRAATYVALAERSAIAEGGTLYVEAPCPEGVGVGSGERACATAMALGPKTLLRELYSTSPPSTSGGAQRAYVLAMALERAKIVLVGAPPISELTAMGIEQIDRAPEVDLIVDDPFHQVPFAASVDRA